MKVAWVYPPLEEGIPQLTQNRFFKWTQSYDVLIYPIIPASACTLLKSEGFNVNYIDAVAMRLPWGTLVSKLSSLEPDLIFMEAKTPVIKHIWQVATKLKSFLPKVKLALCGDHVSVLPRESLERCEAVDYVITGGDFDLGALNLAKALRDDTNLPVGLWYRKAGGIATTGNFQLLGDLDSIPFIDRELVPWWLYHESWRLHDEFLYIMSGRGCMQRCTFCSWPAMLYNYRLRLRSPDNVLDEIERLVDKYGAKEIFDDLDTWPSKGRWARKFCNGMIERGLSERVVWNINARVDLLDYETAKLMKRAGCRVLKIGVESASQETLDRIKKRTTLQQIRDSVRLCRKAGLTLHLTAMIGYPWENRKDVLGTITFIKGLEPDSVQFSIVTPYPGTELYRQALANNWFAVDATDWDSFDMSNPVLKSGDMSPEEVVEFCERAWRSIYFDPKFVLRHLAKVRSMNDLKLLFRGMRSVLQVHVAGLEAS